MLLRTASNRQRFLVLSVFMLAVAYTVPADVEAFQDTPKKTTEKSSADDTFAVPEGNSKELLAFANKIAKLRPRVRSIQELREHLKKANAAIGQAVETILADKSADDETVTAAVTLRFSMLSTQARYDRTTSKNVEEFAKSLATNTRPGVAAIVVK